MNHAASISAAQALESRLAPGFNSMLAQTSLVRLKVIARACRAATRGAKVRADYERAIRQVWRAEVWDEAGYRYGGRPRRYFFAEGQLDSFVKAL